MAASTPVPFEALESWSSSTIERQPIHCMWVFTAEQLRYWTSTNTCVTLMKHGDGMPCYLSKNHEGGQRDVLVHETGPVPLLGNALTRGYN